MGGWDWSEDSRLLFARARHHQVEFNRLLSNDETDRLWSVEEKANKDGTYSYALLVDPSKLEQTKPVAADVANNLVHALDQLVAGLARLYGHDRSRDIYFPWTLDEGKFRRALSKLEPILGAQTISSVLEVRERHRSSLPHVQIVKEVSNSGKHWGLVPSQSSVTAIALNQPGSQQRVWTIPAEEIEDFYYEFFRTAEQIKDATFSMLIGIRFYGLETEVSASPQTIFDLAFRYVEEVIQAVCGTAPRPSGASVNSSY